MWRQAETWQEVFAAILQPAPLLILMIGMGLLFFVAYMTGRNSGTRYCSRKNMPERSREKIDELALRLHDSEAERIRCVAENRVLWSRYQALVNLAMKPLEFEQERRLLETEPLLRMVKR